MKAIGRFTYSSTIAFLQWNPCTGFNAVGSKGVAVTFGYKKNKTSVYGMQKTATFGILDGFDYIGYKGRKGNTRIILQCDEKSEPFIDAVQNFEAQVLAVYKGPCNLKIPRGGSSTLSSGSILLITLFVLLVLYITVGCLVNIYVRKIEGFERIPNYQFWKNLPPLIKDGCLFTWTRRPDYQKM